MFYFSSGAEIRCHTLRALVRHVEQIVRVRFDDLCQAHLLVKKYVKTFCRCCMVSESFLEEELNRKSRIHLFFLVNIFQQTICTLAFSSYLFASQNEKLQFFSYTSQSIATALCGEELRMGKIKSTKVWNKHTTNFHSHFISNNVSIFIW